jgi:hypothetical protein
MPQLMGAAWQLLLAFQVGGGCMVGSAAYANPTWALLYCRCLLSGCTVLGHFFSNLKTGIGKQLLPSTALI